jgi:hypothetical protein
MGGTMAYAATSSSQLLRCLAVILIAGLLTAGSVAATAKSPDDLDIITVSTRPDTVSGGNVLVRINVAPSVAVNDLVILLNGQAITSAFRPEAGGHSLLGLVEGLSIGDNTLIAKAINQYNQTYRTAQLLLTNYPIVGPIISGSHEEPFYCMTQLFTLPASTNTLGPALDADCSIATRVDYVYRTTAGTFQPLPNLTSYPADLAQTTTTEGKSVPYIVRVETGTINRAIYETAVLHDPTTEAAPTPFTPPAAWNHRLAYTLGGGCVGGW